MKDKKGQIGVAIIICLFLIGFCILGLAYPGYKAYKLAPELSQKMDCSIVDVKVYWERTGIHPKDILQSEVLQKHFKMFLDGESTEFNSQSINKKSADDAYYTGQAVGLSTGIAVGMSK